MKNIEVITIEDLLTRTFPSTDSMLGGNVLDKAGALLITGPQKVGKSLLATQLALSLASGQDFLGLGVGKRDYRVLILQAEVSEKRMQERFVKQVTVYRDDARKRVLNACVYSSIKLDHAQGVSTVHAWIDQHCPDLVIVDPLANFHTGDENEAQDMSRVTTALDDIRAKGIAVALVHHHGKGSSRNSNVGHKARGSSVLPGWYDSHMSLEWAEFQRTVRLKFELRHDEAPADIVLRLNPKTLLFEPQSDEAAQISLVVAAIRDLGSTDAETVGNHCGKTRQWASDWLNKGAESQKLVRRDGKPVIFSLPGQPPEMTVIVNTNTADGATHRVWQDGLEVNFGE
jgi:AAA domain